MKMGKTMPEQFVYIVQHFPVELKQIFNLKDSVLKKSIEYISQTDLNEIPDKIITIQKYSKFIQ